MRGVVREKPRQMTPRHRAETLYFLAERYRLYYERRAEWSFVSEPPREGLFRLFNKNSGRTMFVRPVRQAENRYGWFVEPVGEIDPCFQYVLTQA